MRILLSLTPDFYPSAFKWTPPTGLLYLAAVVENHGYKVEILDPIIERLSFRKYIDRILEKNPDVFGLYVTSDSYFTAADIVKALKTARPNMRTIFGEPHPTLLAESILHHLPELDVAVMGAGEISLPQILQRNEKNQSLEGIPNTPDETKESMDRNITFLENLNFKNKSSYVALNITRILFRCLVAYVLVFFERLGRNAPPRGNKR